eukprot:5426521-Amphidinium_carterae.1
MTTFGLWRQEQVGAQLQWDSHVTLIAAMKPASVCAVLQRSSPRLLNGQRHHSVSNVCMNCRCCQCCPTCRVHNNLGGRA